MVRLGEWTKQEMSYFSERVYYWQEKFGLLDWQVETRYTYDDKDDWGAKCSRDPENRCAVITFNSSCAKHSKTIGKKYLNTCALHEVLHLLLADLAHLSPATSSNDKYEHQIVRRLEAYILGLVR